VYYTQTYEVGRKPLLQIVLENFLKSAMTTRRQYVTQTLSRRKLGGVQINVKGHRADAGVIRRIMTLLTDPSPIGRIYLDLASAWLKRRRPIVRQHHGETHTVEVDGPQVGFPENHLPIGGRVYGRDALGRQTWIELTAQQTKLIEGRVRAGIEREINKWLLETGLMGVVKDQIHVAREPADQSKRHSAADSSFDEQERERIAATMGSLRAQGATYSVDEGFTDLTFLGGEVGISRMFHYIEDGYPVICLDYVHEVYCPVFHRFDSVASAIKQHLYPFTPAGSIQWFLRVPPLGLRPESIDRVILGWNDKVDRYYTMRLIDVDNCAPETLLQLIGNANQPGTPQEMCA